MAAQFTDCVELYSTQGTGECVEQQAGTLAWSHSAAVVGVGPGEGAWYTGSH